MSVAVDTKKPHLAVRLVLDGLAVMGAARLIQLGLLWAFHHGC